MIFFVTGECQGFARDIFCEIFPRGLAKRLPGTITAVTGFRRVNAGQSNPDRLAVRSDVDGVTITILRESASLNNSASCCIAIVSAGSIGTNIKTKSKVLISSNL